MQGIEATFDGLEFGSERTNAKLLPQFILGATALALIGGFAGYLAYERLASPPETATPQRGPAVERTAAPAVNPFGEIIIEPGWVPKKAADAGPFPLPAVEAAPLGPPNPPLSEPAPTEPRIQPQNAPLPPVRDVARIEDDFPLPPPRPLALGEPAERPHDDRFVEPSVPAAPPAVGGPDLIQRLLGMAHPSGEAVPSAPPAPPEPRVLARTEPPAVTAALPPTAAAAPQPQGRGGLSGLLGFFSPRPSFDRLGYDRYTAVYDISARVVYLPDGRKLEAHSGLGDKLDDPRYVSERMHGATPPHLYDLALREGSFHGVQALRLNPVGEGGLYGRAGLLAHPYMLGPNGDSNGCVSFKDYAAFLQAYEDGEVRRLAVVARL